MEFTTLGRTGLRVSVAGLGCGGFSRLGLGRGKSATEAMALVRAALDHGVNLIDTAAAYGTEEVLGRALKGRREGVVLAGTIYLPWIYSSEHLNTIADEAAWTPALRGFGEAWADAWDANNLISRYRAAGRFDPSAPFGGDMAKALGRVRAKTLVMPGDRDRTLPPYLAQEIHRGVRDSIYVEIPSPLGHLACCTADEAGFEHRFVSEEIRRFLASLPQPN